MAFFSQLCASPWMVCDSIDFDFSDYHPHGLPSRFALDTPFLHRPGPNISDHSFASGPPCFAGPGFDARCSPHGLCFDSKHCAPRDQHHARLAAQQPQPRINALRSHGLCAFPCGFPALAWHPLFPACRLRCEAATPPL